MKRDCLGAWLPEALASVVAALYALGGQHVKGDDILQAWGLDGDREDGTDTLERWLDRQKVDNG